MEITAHQCNDGYTHDVWLLEVVAEVGVNIGWSDDGVRGIRGGGLMVADV